MTNKMTPTLALVLAGGLAAGIALARPGLTSTSGDATQEAGQPSAPPASGGGYLGGNGGAEAEPSLGTDTASTGLVTIQDFSFSGPNVVAPGAVINVTNDDAPAHTLTSDAGLFDTGNLGQGQSASVVAPNEPGTYTFFCTIHPSMTGSVTVG